MKITLITGSNEGIYNNKKVVIKSARFINTRFGITKQMLKRITEIILAKEIDQKGIFEIYLVPFSSIESTGTDTKSKGSSKGKVKNFNVPEAIRNGRKIGKLQINIPF